MEKNIFYLDKVFPEADKIFSESFRDPEEIIKDGIIILDTNVLLVPFDTNEKHLSDIKNIFLKYKSNNRLFIPARVAREFANNRANKISNVFLQLRQLKDKLNSGTFKIEQYPMLQNNADYQDLLKQFDLIHKSINTSRKHLENIESHIQSWTWNDSVSTAYKEIFTSEIIVEVQKSNEELEKDLAFRIEYKIAPGFKDSKKPDDGVGDLVIWQTILEIAKKEQKDLIFVTNDQKNDWFYKQDKIGLYPKFELFDEFRRFTNGKSISIINFIKFLELSNANKDTINEVKEVYQSNSEQEFIRGLKGIVKGEKVEHTKFGVGTVTEVDLRDPNNKKATINFQKIGSKTLLLDFAMLRRLAIQ